MQTETWRVSLKRSFFSSLDKTDLLVSTVCALLIAALYFSLFFCSSAEVESQIFYLILFYLIIFPINFLEHLGFFLAWPFYFVSLSNFLFLLLSIILYTISFIFKILIFYSLARLTSKILG